jgi:hypothetical protein
MPGYSITITREGKVAIEASGFSGTMCLDTAKPLLEALGGGQDIESNLEALAQTEEEQQW